MLFYMQVLVSNKKDSGALTPQIFGQRFQQHAPMSFSICTIRNIVSCDTYNKTKVFLYGSNYSIKFQLWL